MPIDDHLARPGLAATARREQIDLAQRFSARAPVIIAGDFRL